MVKQINGKSLDIMKENKFKDESRIFLKNILYREMRNGDYLLYADKSELLVVNREVALSIIEKDTFSSREDEELLEILRNNRFFVDMTELNNDIPKEPKSNIFKMMQISLILLFALSVLLIVLNAHGKIIWSSLDLLELKEDIFVLALTGILFSIGTTIFHEFMHVVFSNNIKNIKKIFSISLKKSTVYVSLTHVWTWSIFSRLIAVAAGVMLDAIILAEVSVIMKNNEITRLLITILFLRIIWQFAVYRKTDGKYFLMMLLDNPLIDIDYKDNRKVLSKKEALIWGIAGVIGRIIDLYLLLFWGMPILYKIVLWLGGML